MAEEPPTTAALDQGTTEVRPAAGSGGPPLEPAPAFVSRRIGPWRLLEQMGHGGMGTVYLAERADDEYRRQVALKVIRAGQDGTEVVARFRRERQILAALDHPNIAKLLDGGTTEDGRPYLVMERVDGRSILHYCLEQKLGVAARLRLFVQVCDAVQYAHRSLVVHRDLKPGNILVTPEGVPKLLDFGIAKLIHPEGGLDETPTATGAHVMTPEFASPEQARGDAITTSSDVYSLGVVLYVLLAGRLPYRLKSRQTFDVLRAVVEEDPERPSTVVTKDEGPAEKTTQTHPPGDERRVPEGSMARLSRRLRGDLDTIVLTALRKEPARRYASVEALSEDIRRHLEGLPIRARRPTLAYRSSKFVSRHRYSVSATVLLLVLLAGAAGSLVVQSRRAARERDKSDRLAAFMLDLFALSGPDRAKGNTITAREVLDRGAEKIKANLQAAPEVRASLLSSMARAYQQLGAYDRGLALAQESLALRQKALGQGAETAASFHEVGTLLWRKGQAGEAAAAYRQGLDLRRRLFGRESAEAVESLVGLENALYAKGDYAGAAELGREGVAIVRKHPEYGARPLGHALGGLGTDLSALGRTTEAEPLLREAIEALRRADGSDSPTIGPHLFNLANLLADRGDFEESAALFREGLELYRKTLGNEHPEVASNLNNLAVMLQNKGDLGGAEAAVRESIAIYRKALPDHPDLAPALDTLASVLNASGRPAEAEPLAREAVGSVQKAYGEDHPWAALEMVTLADALAGLSRRTEAEALYRRALAIQAKSLPPGHPDTAFGLVGLGRLLTAGGRAAEAPPFLEQAVDIRRKNLKAGDWGIAVAESAEGACLTALGRYEEAEKLLREAGTVLAKRGDETPDARTNHERLAALYKTWRRP